VGNREGAYLLQSNILPIQRLHQILLPINNLQMSIRIPFPYITRLEPALTRKCFCCQLGILVIPLRDAVTPDPDLALWVGGVGGEVAGVGEIDEFYFDAGGYVGPLEGPVARVAECAHSVCMSAQFKGWMNALRLFGH
jgi:hypothetical protein